MEIILSQFIPAFLLTLFAGLSTGIGALLAFFSKSKNHTFLSIGLGFLAGVMIYVSFDELLPSARLYRNAHTTILGIVLGMMVMAVSLVAFKLI